jgi:preprotein translocase subunit SecD
MKPKYNVAFFIIVFLMSVWFSIPSLTNSDRTPKINLGLDLQGGLYLLLEVDKKNLFENKMKNIASQIKYIADENDLYIDTINISKTKIVLKMLDDTKETQNILNKYFKQEKFKVIHKENIKEEIGIYEIELDEKQKNTYLEEKLIKTLEVIRNRLNQFGLSEPSVVRNGKDRIVVEVPGVSTVEEEQRIVKLITTTAYLQFMKVAKSKKNSVSYPYINNPKLNLDVENITILDGSYLENAMMGFDQNNRVQIQFEFNTEGGHIFKKFTSENIGERLAIVIDNKIYSAPTIQSAIGRNGSITGDFTVEEAKDLAIALKSGSSGVKVNILEKKTIGASLGEESIINGALSLIIGFLLVIIFIIYFYKQSGLIIAFALIVNLFMILAIMASMNATMTLPGIIGIVLTVGMAIDSNIIINERINEELLKGTTVSKAIEAGYNRAFLTIFDANITTILAAMVLYSYGNSTIKGFALTLIIGIISSMFTSIYGTKNLFLVFNPTIKPRGNKNV